MSEAIHSPPDEVWPAAKVDDAPRQALVHRHVGFAGEGVSGVETCTVTADSLLVAKRFQESLPERDSAIFDGVMRIYFQIAVAAQVQVDYRML